MLACLGVPFDSRWRIFDFRYAPFIRRMGLRLGDSCDTGISLSPTISTHREHRLPVDQKAAPCKIANLRCDPEIHYRLHARRAFPWAGALFCAVFAIGDFVFILSHNYERILRSRTNRLFCRLRTGGYRCARGDYDADFARVHSRAGGNSRRHSHPPRDDCCRTLAGRNFCNT